ncbi:MAG: AbgT family transporter [Cardiobacteriaceae bacterium]|nr:AbgT family transporter [Cardiobacteriaceae bacterium]
MTGTPSGKGVFNRFLNIVERAGNRLPDPFMLFVWLALLVVAASWVFSWFGASVVHPGSGKTLEIKSLVSGEGLQYMLTSMISNFTGFAPLGLVLSMMMGIGLADKVGLLDYGIRKSIMKSPPALLTYSVAFVGIMGNLASDAAMLLIPPLAAMVFYKVGRHPLAGLAVGYAATGAGFTANLFIVGTDALLSGISTEAAKIVNPALSVSPADNWYFNIVSVFVMTLLAGFMTTHFIEPRLGKYQGEAVTLEVEEDSPLAARGLRNAGIAALLYIAVLVIIIAWPGSPLRNENGGLIPSPFLKGIVPIILLFFITIGVTYGKTTGKIQSSRDAVRYMSESIRDLSGYIVLIFAISQFIAYFNWSNIGVWIAVNGAAFLKDIEFTGMGLIVGYILFTSMLNFLITSGSAKWAIEAPVFVPMFMELGYHPAFTQAAYRIADSSTNIITPLMPYMVVILTFMQKYDKKAGVGTLISLMLPYSLAFLAVWILLILAFYYLGIPFGPGIMPHL